MISKAQKPITTPDSGRGSARPPCEELVNAIYCLLWDMLEGCPELTHGAFEVFEPSICRGHTLFKVSTSEDGSSVCRPTLRAIAVVNHYLPDSQTKNQFLSAIAKLGHSKIGVNHDADGGDGGSTLS